MKNRWLGHQTHVIRTVCNYRSEPFAVDGRTIEPMGYVLFGPDAVRRDRPETWFHIIGGNATKAGLTADMEALKDAGFGGIQFFHGQFGEAEAWDGVPEQIPCLSAKWDDLVAQLLRAHVGACARERAFRGVRDCVRRRNPRRHP
jgi:hypothetical protein